MMGAAIALLKPSFWRSSLLPTSTKRSVTPHIKRRSMGAAKMDNLTLDFPGTYKSANAELMASLPRIRARSRSLANDNDYARKFLMMVKTNVVGSNGIRLQARAKNERGKLDLVDNRAIEAAFKIWSSRNNASSSGKLSWADIQRLFIASCAKDGEAILRIVNTGKFGFTLQQIDPARLEVTTNLDLSNGNRVRMGIELDLYDKPVAYHLLTNNPGDVLQTNQRQRMMRIPADQIIHAFMFESPEQLRGMPWMHTAIRRLNMLGGYEEAALVASRLGASKMGFYTTPANTNLSTDGGDDTELVESASPGTFEELPEGYGFESYDPAYPNVSHSEFVKNILRGAASGLLVAYNGLSGDLEGVSFSSIRQGVLEEREIWRLMQKWLIEQLHEPVYQAWLPMAITSGQLKLPMRKLEKFKQVTWQARGWDWVDPQKDMMGKGMEYGLGITSLTDIAGSKGKDLEEVMLQNEQDHELAKKHGIDIKLPGRLVSENEEIENATKADD